MKTFTLSLFCVLCSNLVFGSSFPVNIKGALIFSPAEIHSFAVSNAQLVDCETTTNKTFETTACKLKSTDAVFVSAQGKNVVSLTRVFEIRELKEVPGDLVRSYALSGNWESTVNGFTVKSPLHISLYEYKAKPKEYVGFLEFKSFGYNKIPLSAKAE